MNKLIKICALSLSLGVLGGTITSCNSTQTTPVDYSEAVSTPDLVKIDGDDIVVLEETTQLSVISKEEVVGYWTTSDPSIATVDKEGLVTAKSTGEVTISYVAFSTDGKKTWIASKTMYSYEFVPSFIETVKAIQRGKTYTLTVKKSSDKVTEEMPDPALEETYEWKYAGNVVLCTNKNTGAKTIYTIDANGQAIIVTVDKEGEVKVSEPQKTVSGYITEETFYVDKNYPYTTLFPSLNCLDTNFLPAIATDNGKYDLNSSTNQESADPEGKSDRDTGNMVNLQRLVAPDNISLSQRLSLKHMYAVVNDVYDMTIYIQGKNRVIGETGFYNYEITLSDVNATTIDEDTLALIEGKTATKETKNAFLTRAQKLLSYKSYTYTAADGRSIDVVEDKYIWYYYTDDAILELYSSYGDAYGTMEFKSYGKIVIDGIWQYCEQTVTVDSSDPENPAVVRGEIINYEWGWEDIETYPTVKELGYSTPSTWGITQDIDALVSTTTYLGVDYGFDSTNRDLCYDLNDQFASITGLVDSTSIGATNTPALIRLMFTDSPYAASYCVVAEEDKDCKLTVGLYYRDNRIVDITSSGNGHHVALSNFGNVDNPEIKAYLESLAK